MRSGFLIGNFLPAYGRSFGRLRGRGTRAGGLPAERLAVRFQERAVSYVRRRREYLTLGQAGVVLSLGVMLVAFRVDFSTGPVELDAVPEQELVQMEEIIQTAQIQRPPPPPRPPVPVAVPDDVVLDNEDLDLDAFLDLDAALDAPPPPPPQAAVEEEVDEDEIFLVVEQAPEIIGGLAKLYEVVPYPPLARKAGLEGTVVVQIVVNTDGTPSDPTVVRGVAESLNNAAVEGVMQLRFRPAMQRSRAVRVYMTLPVRFRLN